MKQFRYCLLFTIAFMMVFSTSSLADFFTHFMEEFIKEGKEVNILLNEEIEEFNIISKENLILESENTSFIALEAGEKYRFSLEKTEEIFYTVQIFASLVRENANQAWNRFLDMGYSELSMIKEDDLYKLRIGNFSNKDDAQFLINDLKKQGWNPWLLEKKQVDDVRINVYDAREQLLFWGNQLSIKGDIKIDSKNYQGKSTFILENGILRIENRTQLENILAGIMDYEFKGQEVSSEVLKAYAISLRTHILSLLYNNNGMALNISKYQGLSEREEFISAVRRTEGIVMEDKQKEGQLYSINRLFYFRLNHRVFTDLNYDYRDILNTIYSDFYFRDLKELLFRQTMVNAEIRWGLRYKEIRETTWYGPRVITLVEVDLDRRFIYIEPVLAQGRVPGLEDLSMMLSRKEGALVGINGGYFHYSGRPLGLIYKEGEIISEPIFNRTALILTDENEAVFSQLSWEGIINHNGSSISVNGVNRVPGENEVTIFNKYYSNTAPAIKLGILELIVKDDLVKEINYMAEERANVRGSSIPDDGFIIRVHGTSRQKFDEVKVGDKIILENNFTPDFDDLNVKTAIAAGPLLIKDSEISITSSEERFQPDIALGRAPRTAVGKTKDNKLVFFTVDGRQNDYSIGISLNELANFMQDYGINDGMNLDGGNSARMVVRGFTMNRPSADRFISNGIIIGTQM